MILIKHADAVYLEQVHLLMLGDLKNHSRSYAEKSVDVFFKAVERIARESKTQNQTSNLFLRRDEWDHTAADKMRGK